MVAYLLSVAVAGELQRVPATRTHTINGTETVIPEDGWMVVDEEGRRIGPVEFALAVGDTETLALLETIQTRRDRRGIALMVVGLSAAAGPFLLQSIEMVPLADSGRQIPGVESVSGQAYACQPVAPEESVAPQIEPEERP